MRKLKTAVSILTQYQMGGSDLQSREVLLHMIETAQRDALECAEEEIEHWKNAYHNSTDRERDLERQMENLL